MLEKIIVGYDGDETGDEALALAVAFARVSGGKLLIAHVFDDLVTRVSEEAAALVANHVHEVFTRAGGLVDRTVRHEMIDLSGTSPARELSALAEGERADLLVVGSRRLSTAQRITLGSVSNAVLHGAPCAVAVAPRKYHVPEHPLRRIAVGWIPTSEGDAALEFAHALAVRTTGTLNVVTTVSVRTAIPVVGAAALIYDRCLEDMRRGAKRDVDAAVKRLGGDVEVTVDAEISDAAEEFVLRSPGLDLIVLGSRGYGAIRRVLLGGVSFRVLRDAECPVVLLPRAGGGASAT